MPGVAPVCHVSVDEVINQPTGTKLPSIPIATDLISALAAINAMRQVLMMLTGALQGPPGLRGAQGQGGAAGAAAKKTKVGRWNEANRTTATERVYNPNDNSQYVDVQRINSLTMTDSVTGETWVWNH